jgi:hypothetical protein
VNIAPALFFKSLAYLCKKFKVGQKVIKGTLEAKFGVLKCIFMPLYHIFGCEKST